MNTKKTLLILLGLFIGGLAAGSCSSFQSKTAYEICRGGSATDSYALAILGQATASANSNTNKNTNTNINSNKKSEPIEDCLPIYRLESRERYLQDNCDDGMDKECRDRLRYIESGELPAKE